MDFEYPLADIAAACGFADQSHFTRVFARSMGTPPGSWRRGEGRQLSRGARQQVVMARHGGGVGGATSIGAAA